MTELTVYVLESTILESAIIDEIKKNENCIIIPLNHLLVKFLQKKRFKISVESDILNFSDYGYIDKSALELSGNWYKENTDEKLIYQGIDISKTFQQELNQIFLRIMHKIILLEKIIEKFNPKLIKFSKSDIIIDDISKKMFNSNGIKYEILKNNIDNQIRDKFDKVNFSIRIFGKNKEITVSKKIFRILKYVYEIYWDTKFYFKNMPHKHKINTNKSILFLDFNLTLHENFLKYLSEKNYNLLFMNNRRPIIWNKYSLKIASEIIFEKINPIKIKTQLKNEEYFKEFEKKVNNNCVFENSQIMKFQLENIFKNFTLEIMKNRLPEIFSKIDHMEKLIKVRKIDFVWVLDDWGNDRVIVNVLQKNNIPVFFFLSGSLANLKSESYFWPLTIASERVADKLVIWGENDFQNCLESEVDPKKIEIGGAPRYDKFDKISKSDENYILILVGGFPSTTYSYFLSSSFILDFEKRMKDIFFALKGINKKIILKRHPTQGHNEILDYEKMIHDIIPNSVILKEADTIKLISKASLIISVPSTVLEESILLDKPIIFVPYLDSDDAIPYSSSGAVIKIRKGDNISQIINECLYNEKMKKELKKGRENFIEKVFKNLNNASSTHEIMMKGFFK